MHIRRAESLLKENWAYLYELRERVGRPEDSGKHDSTTRLQQGLHYLLIAAALGQMTLGLVH